MDKHTFKIKSKGPNSNDAEISIGDYSLEELPAISKITIILDPNNRLQAVVVFSDVELDLEAELKNLENKEGN